MPFFGGVSCTFFFFSSHAVFLGGFLHDCVFPTMLTNPDPNPNPYEIIPVELPPNDLTGVKWLGLSNNNVYHFILGSCKKGHNHFTATALHTETFIYFFSSISSLIVKFLLLLLSLHFFAFLA